MRFPLADFLDAHRDCRHNLGESGMHGTLPPPPAPARTRGREVLDDLREELARSIGIPPDRLTLTHGATEANAWVTFYLRRGTGVRRPSCRVRLPEYPPLFEVAQAAGFRLVEDQQRAQLAVVSRPRNPEGDLWDRSRLLAWAEGAPQLLVDETFREFADARSLARGGDRGIWVSGSFTKFYGADDLRVGYVIAPPEEAERFGRFAGLVLDELSPASAAGALTLLRRRTAVRREVRRVLDRNLAVLAAADPTSPRPVGPVYFDRSVTDADRLVDRCLEASVLVTPGRFFGEPGGVRIGLTRRSFPKDLDAYLRIRRQFAPGRLRAPANGRGARRRRGGAG